MVSEAPPEQWGTPHYVPQRSVPASAPSASASSGAQQGASTPPDAQASTSANGQPALEADTSLQAESDITGDSQICDAPLLLAVCSLIMHSSTMCCWSSHVRCWVLEEIHFVMAGRCRLDHTAPSSLLQIKLEVFPVLTSMHFADLHAAPVKIGGLEDDGPSRKRARLKDGKQHSSKQPALHGGTLIVAPTAVLNQWDQELAAKASPAAGRLGPPAT